MNRSFARLILVLLVLSHWIAASAGAQSDGIRNPYYKKTAWKVWLEDAQPVENAGVKLIAPPEAERKRVAVAESGGQLQLKLVPLDKTVTGSWDDVYVNQDNGHSGFSWKWPGPKSSFNLQGQVITARLPLLRLAIENGKIVNKGPTDLKKVGANFTSQSTTHMGHHIANNGLQMVALEQEFYFADVLRAGPAHVSFREQHAGPSEDLYQALVPSLFNSYGSSGSEMQGLTKMVIAGSFIRPELKKKIKQHGIYPATLLYLWKKSLPYDVPYAHELRHRVAYFTKGDHSNYNGPTKAHYNFEYHAYDEQEHLRRMIQAAKKLQVAPPVSILSQLKVTSGKPVYMTRTAALIHQEKQDVRFQFSAADSYDIQGRDLTIACIPICGNPKTKVTRVDATTFAVEIPFNPDLPRGRTSLLVVANNGIHDSNPSIINVFHGEGKPNQRPRLEVQKVWKILPGEKLQVPVKAEDPEGFPVHLYVRPDAGDKVQLKDNRVTFRPGSDKSGTHGFSILASDRCSGSSQNSRRIEVLVQPLIAEANVELDRQADFPNHVRLDASASRSLGDRQLQFRWLVNDRPVGDSKVTSYRLPGPGVHRVDLIVTNGSHKDQATRFVEVVGDWTTKIDNGWTREKGLIDWKPINESCRLNFSSSGAQVLRTNKENKQTGLISLEEFSPPLRIDATYRRARYARGAGFRILGTFIGDLVGPTDSNNRVLDTAIGYRDADNQWHYKMIGSQPKTPALASKLRCYVTQDPNLKDRWVYSGYLETEVDRYHFRFSVPRTNAAPRLELLLGETSLMTVKELNVYSSAR